MTALKDLEPYVDGCIDVFLEKMKEQEGRVVDMGYWLQLFAFGKCTGEITEDHFLSRADVIGEVTFSKRFGFMDSGNDHGAFDKILAATESASWVGQIPAIYWLNDYLTPIIGNKLAIAHRHGSVREFAVKEITARLDRGSSHQDILSKLEAVHKEKPLEFDRDNLVSMATSNVFAGSDTTAISIRAILYFLMKNPNCKQRLIEEIDTFDKQGKLSASVKLEEADKMPYLQAVMYEA